MINKEVEYFNTVSQMDLKNNYRTFYPITLEHVFLSQAYETSLGYIMS